MNYAGNVCNTLGVCFLPCLTELQIHKLLANSIIHLLRYCLLHVRGQVCHGSILL